MASKRLEGKVAIVTGAASGFGKEIAAKFSREGAKVILADLSKDAGQAAAAEVGGHFVRADVTKVSSWEDLLAAALKHHGQLDIVVNNAGTTYANKATETVTEAEFDLVMNVNVKSIFLSTQVLLPYFLEQGRPAAFIQIASTSGSRPRGGLTWYSATKGAVITATKSLASEYGPKQIRFNSVSPVVASTGLTHLFIGKEATEENLAGFVSTVPLGRPAAMSDVANACCYLASNEASFITGVDLPVDGGRCI